jgi:hypothetical protein
MPASTVTCPACRTELRFKGPLPAGVTEAVCPRCGARIPLAPNSSGEHPASDTAPAVTGAGAREDSTRTDAWRPAGASPAEFAFLAPPQTPDEIGRLGPYRVLSELGRGGSCSAPKIRNSGGSSR